MPTLVVTYTFDTDAQGFGFQAAWYSLDGSDFAGASAPGCMRINFTSSASFFGQSCAGPTRTWEQLGVPAGSTINTVGLRYRSKLANFVTDGVATLNEEADLFAEPSGSTIATFYSADITGQDNAWHTKSGGPFTLGAPYNVSTQRVNLSIGFACNNRINSLITVDERYDTVELTITYTGPPALTNARSASEVSARSLLTNSGVPIGGGAIHARSAGVSAVALLTNTNTACLEVYFAGVDNGDDFTAMVYSAPTELCLLNPVAGHEYILEAPAADLARFLGKRMGNVKFRRAGAGGNYSGALLLRAIELYYKVKT